MKIQRQNSYNPNMKALYFTKIQPTRNPSVIYDDIKFSECGIKYVEDTSAKLTPILKEAFAENFFVKKLAEKYDCFVQYLGEHYDIKMGNFNSEAKIYIAGAEIPHSKMFSYTYCAKDRFSPEGSRLRLLADIEENLCLELDGEPSISSL